jgi:3-phosphoshikimate 1-carboxyvinyltransferase
MEQFGIRTEYGHDHVVVSKSMNVNMPSSFVYDFNSCPDLVMPLAVLCASLQIPSEFMGVRNLRIKESDRLAVLKSELAKTGTTIALNDDSFFLRPSSDFKLSEPINAHNDHRMVMAFATLALRLENVLIDDQHAVSKSYPEFWNHFAAAGFQTQIEEGIL